MNNYYVYAHFTLDENELFYIGKGKANRAYCQYKRNNYWNAVINKHGYLVVILKDNLTEQEAFDLEKIYIKEYQPKCNFHEGGQGGGSYFFYMSDIQKAITCHKKRQSMLGKNKGISKTSEHREKLKCDWRSKQIICKDTGIIYRSIEDCRRQLNLGSINISRHINNGWKCQGYTLDFYHVK